MQIEKTQFHKNKNDYHYLRRGLSDTQTMGWFFIFILIFCCMSGRDIFFSVAIGGIVESALAGDISSLTNYLIILAIAAGISVPLQIFVAYSDGRFGAYGIRNLYRRILPPFLRIPERIFEGENTSGYQSRLTGDVSQVQAFFTSELPAIVWTCVYGLVPLLYLLYLNPFLALVSYGLIPFIYWIISKLMAPISKLTSDASAAQAKALSIIRETISQIESVKSYGLDSLMQKRYDKAQGEALVLVKSMRRIEAISSGINNVSHMLPILLLVFLGVWQMTLGELTIAGLVVFTNLGGSGQWFISSLSEMLGQLRIANGHLKRIYEASDVEPEREGGLGPKDETETIAVFDGVTFHYDGRNTTFRDLNFTIKKGETVAIVGESGTGKSTALKLMEGFYSPEEGQVKMWGQSVDEIDLHALRQRIAIIPQSPFLITGSLRENIIFGDKKHDDQAILTALKKAGLTNIKATWPEGLDTRIAENGSNLSGGQKQRIAIARAILRETPMLLLDEVTSALDYETEREIYQSIQALSQKHTMLIISHRLSMVKGADHILVLENGRIVEEGSHDTLMEKNGLYTKLYEVELAGGNEDA